MSYLLIVLFYRSAGNKNANAFADTLDDPRVEEKLQNILKSLLMTVSKEITKPLEDKIGELSVLVKRLQSDLALSDSRLDDLTAENRKLRNDLQTAAAEVRNLEQYSRRDNLVISGLPATFAETAAATDESFSDSQGSTEQKVLDLCNLSLGLQLSSDDISSAPRLKSSRNHGASLLILLRFTRCSTRFKLKNENSGKRPCDRIYINEDLIDFNRRLLGAAKQHVKNKSIKSAFTSNCRIK